MRLCVFVIDLLGTSVVQLLDRVFNIIAGNNPDLAVNRGKMVMCPSRILREGTRKTVFVNFMESCKTCVSTFVLKKCTFTRFWQTNHLQIYIYRLRRDPNHVMDFFLSEMATTGSIDGQNRLVIKGRFAPKSFESILRRYISKCPHAISLLQCLKCALARTNGFLNSVGCLWPFAFCKPFRCVCHLQWM